MARNEILTGITLNELKERNVDVLSPVDFAEICCRGGKKPENELYLTLQKIHGLVHAGLPIKLDVKDCCFLLTLVELKGFCHTPMTPYRRWNGGFRGVTQGVNTEYLNLYGWRKYHLLSFGDQTVAARNTMRKILNRYHHLAGCAKARRVRRAVVYEHK